MSAFKKRVIRCWVDITSTNPFNDLNTNAQPSTWNAVGFQIQVAFGIGPQNNGQLADISNVTAFLAKIWTGTTTYIDATQTALLTTLTYANWVTGNATNDPSACHAYFDFVGASVTLAVPAGGSLSFKLTLHGATTDAPTDPDCFGVSNISFFDAGLAATGPVQASNIVPLAAAYDGSGNYTLTVTTGVVYIWTQGSHDTSVTNAAQTITDGSVWIAAGASVILNGTPGATITAAVWYPVPLTVSAFQALFQANIGSGGANVNYSGTESPEGVHIGNIGDTYKQISGGVLLQVWTKVTGTGTITGWA